MTSFSTARIFLARVLVLFLLLCMGSAYAGELLSKRQFTRQFVETLREQYPEVKVKTIAPLELEVELEDSGKAQVYLDNVWDMYLQDSSDVDELLAQRLRGMQSIFEPDEISTLQKDIVPLIKNRVYVKGLKKLRKEGKGPKLVSEKLVGDLYIVYAFDSEFSMQLMSSDSLKELPLKRSQLRDIAIRNLRERLPPTSVEGYESLVMLTAGGTFESSLILIDEIWNKDNFPFEGDLVVFVLARDTLLVTGTEEKEGLAAARDYIQTDGPFAYAITNQPYRRSGNRWVKFR